MFDTGAKYSLFRGLESRDSLGWGNFAGPAIESGEIADLRSRLSVADGGLEVL